MFNLITLTRFLMSQSSFQNFELRVSESSFVGYRNPSPAKNALLFCMVAWKSTSSLSGRNQEPLKKP